MLSAIVGSVSDSRTVTSSVDPASNGSGEGYLSTRSSPEMLPNFHETVFRISERRKDLCSLGQVDVDFLPSPVWSVLEPCLLIRKGPNN